MRSSFLATGGLLTLVVCLVSAGCRKETPPASQPAEPSVTAPPAHVFRFTPKSGEILRHRITLKSVGTIALAPGLPGARFTQNTTQEISERCREVLPDGSAVVDMTLDRIATRMNMAGVVLDYDSATFDPAKEKSKTVRLIGRVYSALIGCTLTITFDAQGTPTVVTGMKEAVAKAIAPVRQELGNDSAGRSASQIIDGITAMFDDATVADQMKSFYRFIPDKTGTVPVGETWRHDWTMTLAVLNTDCDAQGEYELLGYERFRGRPCARIGIKESFKMGSNPAGRSTSKSQPAAGLGRLLQNMDLALSASGGEGTAYWDYQTGVLVQLLQTQHITIDVRFKNQPPPPSSGPAESKPTPSEPLGSLSQKFVTSVQIELLDGQNTQSTTRPATAATAGPP